jgi:hypothetical protein
MQECFLERWRFARGARDRLTAMHAAVDWLCAAQDARDDGGVSHSYLVGEGWMRSYPETTGYILPTFLNAAGFAGGEDLRDRALRMADWEISIQLPSGATADLVDGRPTVFDTGQVLFGYLAAWRESHEQKYLDAAVRSGDWLAQSVDPDGVWRHESDSGGPGRTYNVRVAWALLELHRVLGRDLHLECARRFARWTLTQERGSAGWFDRNCLTDDAHPLLHTIAYTARGQFESGLLLEDSDLVAASRRTVESLLLHIDARGRMAGRFSADWSPAVRWSCLTGMAQLSILLRRFASHDERRQDRGVGRVHGYREAASRLNDFLCRVQDTSSASEGLRGGVRGSFPIYGAYGRWRVLNWATKFFLDALILEADEQRLTHPG